MDGPDSHDPLSLVVFEEFVKRTQGPLFGFVRTFGCTYEQARDVVQDTYEKASFVLLRVQHPFVAGCTDAIRRTWLFSNAARKAKSLLRHEHVLDLQSIEAGDPPMSDRLYTPISFEDQVAEGEAVRAAIASLPLLDRLCLKLSVEDGFSAKQIGEILEISSRSVSRHLHRAKESFCQAYFALAARSLDRKDP